MMPLRIAAREALRARARTLLTVVLIGLPVAAIVAAAVLWRTSTPTVSEQLNRALGVRAAALVLTSPQDAWVVAGNTAIATDAGVNSLPNRSDRSSDPRVVRSAIRDRPTLPIRVGYATSTAAGNTFPVTVTDIDPAAPLAAGLYRLTAGAWPKSGEVVVNEATREAGNYRLGEDLRMVGAGGTTVRRIVGVAESRSLRSVPIVVGPGSLPANVAQQAWLVGGRPFTWGEAVDVAKAGGLAIARDLVLHPPAALATMRSASTVVDPMALTAIVVVFTMALMELVLLAGPAFAVGARRQARTLALIGASGGTPRHVRRVVLASAVVLGGTAAGLGAVLGLAAAPVLEPFVQTHQSTWFGELRIPWDIVAVAVVFGFGSALLAAVVPAWVASRQDVTAVLTGRRGEPAPSSRVPLLGILIFGLGVAAAVAGAHETGTVGGAGIGGAAIVCVIGMIMVVPYLLGLVMRWCSRLPLPLRFAARDAVRHRTRTVPAVAAVAATMSGIIAIWIVNASYDTRDRATYTPNGPVGQGQISLGGVRGDRAVAQIAATVRRAVPGIQVATVESTAALGPQLVVDAGGAPATLLTSYRGPAVWVADRLPADVADWPGAQRAARALAAGGVVALVDQAIAPVVRLAVDGQAGPRVLPQIPVASLRVPNGMIAPTMMYASRSAVAHAGLTVRPSLLIFSGAQITPSEQRTINGQLGSFDASNFEPGFLPRLDVERGYQSGSTAVVLLILIGLGLILMLGGTVTATALAVSDARPDLATLAAVGARASTRRAIAGAYALTIGWIGTGIGTLVGLVPGIAAAYSLAAVEGHRYVTIPWLEIAVIGFLAPLATAGVVAVAVRSRLPLVARVA